MGVVWEEGCDNMKDQYCSTQGCCRTAGVSEVFLHVCGDIATKDRRTSGVTRGVCVAELCVLGVHPSLCSELHSAQVHPVHLLGWGRTSHGWM